MRNTNHIEAQRRLFQNIRHMEESIKGGSTFKVATRENGNLVEYTEKIQIETHVADTDCSKYHMNEGGSQLLSKEYTSDLGLY